MLKSVKVMFECFLKTKNNNFFYKIHSIEIEICEGFDSGVFVLGLFQG
jgi:hypothetical protein